MLSRVLQRKIHEKMMLFGRMRVALDMRGGQFPTMFLRLLTGATAFCALPLTSPALASSSGWIETEGGRVRLVTSGMPDAQGHLRGALEIALKPGWKTYWRDPGDAGIAPSLDIGRSINVSAAEIDFPRPKRFDDGYSVWAGYDQPVSLPVTFTIDKPERFAAIDAGVFLGICDTVCIPVQGMLSLDPGSDPENPQDTAIVEAAFSSLPSPARADFGVTDARLVGETLVIGAEIPAGMTGGELFLAGEDGFAFGTPVRKQENGATIFKAPLVGRATAGAAPTTVRYVLKTDQGTVSGVLSP
jgi:DsbC/DsbD-like thiol-disulfide interchange protein